MANSGAYFGAEAMMGEKGLDIRKLVEAITKKKEAYQKGMSKRKKWGGISDLLETVVGFIPGVGKPLKAGMNVLSEQLIQDLVDVEGGPDLSKLETMWTGGEGVATQEEFEKMYEASDVSLGQGLIREATDFMGSELGGEFMGKAWEGAGDLFSGFGGGGMEGTPVADTSDIFRAREGGKVPKYENGGRAPEKGDIDKLTALLELYSKGDPKVKSGKSKFVEGGGYSEDYFAEKFGIDPEAMSIDTVSYQDPKNYLFNILSDGEKAGDASLSGNIWPRKMEYSKDKRREVEGLKEKIGSTNYMRIMSDLMEDDYKNIQSKIDAKYFDMDRFKQMDYDMKNFKQGGQVPQYYGGGSVSEGSPTIAGYFSQQGKTLGGSNTQSLAEKLGRK